MVSTRGNVSSDIAPTNEKEMRGGVVKYFTEDGHSSERRQDAYQQMHDFCKSPYTITNESVKQDNSVVVPIEGIFVNPTTEWIYLSFKCN